MNKRVLVVAAHPDDELLGVGGIILRHSNNGDQVRVVIMCEGESFRYAKDVGQSIATQKAADILGVEQVYSLDYPDQKLDMYTLTELIEPLEIISEEFKPNIIYCQSACDANRDHKIVFEAANIAFRPINMWIEEFYTFYTVSSTEWGYPRDFVPDTWIDISIFLERKRKAFECYTSEIRVYPHPRSTKSLENQSHFWGNQCCMDSAEVLMTIRRTIRK